MRKRMQVLRAHSNKPASAGLLLVEWSVRFLTYARRLGNALRFWSGSTRGGEKSVKLSLVIFCRDARGVTARIPFQSPVTFPNHRALRVDPALGKLPKCMRGMRLKPAEPVAGSPTMRGDDQNLNVRLHQPVQYVVREPRHAVAPNARRKLNAIPIRRVADLVHRSIEGRQTPCAESCLASLVVGDVFQMFDSRRLVEEVAHFSKALACWRTSSAGIRWDSPLSISAARCAASANQRGSISASDKASRLESSCAANSALSRTGRDKASMRMVSMFMRES